MSIISIVIIIKPLRVELLVVDNEGKEICKSIPPNVPSELKTN